MARSASRKNRQQPHAANRRSVTAPLAGKPKSQSGGEPVTPRRGIAGVGRFTGEVRAELGKVDFPNRHQTLQSTFVVLGLCLIVGTYLYGLDQVFAVLVKHLVNWQNG
jgi:preprotein translocase subunit SecE